MSIELKMDMKLVIMMLLNMTPLQKLVLTLGAIFRGNMLFRQPA